jgi:hypothetical protein
MTLVQGDGEAAVPTEVVALGAFTVSRCAHISRHHQRRPAKMNI